MIYRYEQKDVAEIWSDENKYNNFLKLQKSLLLTLEQKKVLPKGMVTKHIGELPDSVNEEFMARIVKYEEVNDHDVASFVDAMISYLPDCVGKYVHFGLTSSDLVDSSLFMQIRNSVDILTSELFELCNCLNTLVVDGVILQGRTHGKVAEPISTKSLISRYCADLLDIVDDYDHYIKKYCTGQMSGAVGNYSVLSKEIASMALIKVGLRGCESSSQIINRSKFARFLSSNALLASMLEKIATDFRLYCIDGVDQIQMTKKLSIKGSSTMPHKVNPHRLENVCGMSRLVRSYADIGLQNVNLWNERDISHSSNERIIFEDSFGYLIHMIRTLKKSVSKLSFRDNSIKIKKDHRNYTNVALHYLLHSHVFINRDKAYKIVKDSSLSAKDLEEFVSTINFHVDRLGCGRPLDIKRLDKIEW